MDGHGQRHVASVHCDGSGYAANEHSGHKHHSSKAGDAALVHFARRGQVVKPALVAERQQPSEHNGGNGGRGDEGNEGNEGNDDAIQMDDGVMCDYPNWVREMLMSRFLKRFQK